MREPHLPLDHKRAHPGSEFIQADFSVDGVGPQYLKQSDLPETEVPPCKVVPLVEPHALEGRHGPSHGHLRRSRYLSGQSKRLGGRPTRWSRAIGTSDGDGHVKQPWTTSAKT